MCFSLVCVSMALHLFLSLVWYIFFGRAILPNLFRFFSLVGFSLNSFGATFFAITPYCPFIEFRCCTFHDLSQSLKRWTIIKKKSVEIILKLDVYSFDDLLFSIPFSFVRFFCLSLCVGFFSHFLVLVRSQMIIILNSSHTDRSIRFISLAHLIPIRCVYLSFVYV